MNMFKVKIDKKICIFFLQKITNNEAKNGEWPPRFYNILEIL